MSYTDDLKFKECVENPDNYFKKVEVTNFDLVNHECRDDSLHKDEKHNTINSSNFKKDSKNTKRRCWVLLLEIKKGGNYG